MRVRPPCPPCVSTPSTHETRTTRLIKIYDRRGLEDLPPKPLLVDAMKPDAPIVAMGDQAKAALASNGQSPRTMGGGSIKDAVEKDKPRIAESQRIFGSGSSVLETDRILETGVGLAVVVSASEVFSASPTSLCQFLGKHFACCKHTTDSSTQMVVFPLR